MLDSKSPQDEVGLRVAAAPKARTARRGYRGVEAEDKGTYVVGNVDLRYPSSLSSGSLICSREISFLSTFCHTYFLYSRYLSGFYAAHD